MNNYDKILNGELSSGDAANLVESLEARIEELENDLAELWRLADIVCLNAEIQPDARMKNTTDIYAVPIDDIENLAKFKDRIA